MKKMRRTSTLAFVLLSMITVHAQADILSTFDSDAQGWLVGDLSGVNPAQGNLVHIQNGGIPGGYIEVEDLLVGRGDAAIRLQAPAPYLGDLSGFNNGILSFSAQLFGGTWDTNNGWGRFELSGSGIQAEGDFAPGAPTFGIWTTYSGTFSASTFGVSGSDFASLIANVTSFVLIAEDVRGSDEIVGYDNINLRAVPLPPSLLLLSLATGVLGVVWHRRS